MEIEVEDSRLIVTKTDLKGLITYANPYFLELVEYRESELLKKPHNIIRHKDMPKAVFKLLWNNIQDGKEVNAFVKNTTKNGDFYWVKANITPSFKDNQIIGYFSVRRKAKTSSIHLIEGIYTKMRQVEITYGIDKSLEILTDFLKEQGVSYEKFISNL